MPARLTLEQKRQIIEALLACHTLQTRQGRDDVVGRLPAAIRDGILRHKGIKSDVANILNRCLNYADGLQNLLDALEFYENDSIPFQEASSMIAQFTGILKRKSRQLEERQTQDAGSTQPDLSIDSIPNRSRALETAKRALAILEQQAAGYTSLTIPAHLKIELEDKRKEIVELKDKAGPDSIPELLSGTNQAGEEGQPQFNLASDLPEQDESAKSVLGYKKPGNLGKTPDTNRVPAKTWFLLVCFGIDLILLVVWGYCLIGQSPNLVNYIALVFAGIALLTSLLPLVSVKPIDLSDLLIRFGSNRLSWGIILSLTALFLIVTGWSGSQGCIGSCVIFPTPTAITTLSSSSTPSPTPTPIPTGTYTPSTVPPPAPSPTPTAFSTLTPTSIPTSILISSPTSTSSPTPAPIVTISLDTFRQECDSTRFGDPTGFLVPSACDSSEHPDAVQLAWRVPVNGSFAGCIVTVPSAITSTASRHTYLAFWVRGSQGTERFQIGVKSQDAAEWKVTVSLSTMNWHQVIIPLKRFGDQRVDLLHLEKLIVAFGYDLGSTARQGSICIDQLGFGPP